MNDMLRGRIEEAAQIRRRFFVSDIQAAVAHHYGLTVDDLKSREKARRFSIPRQVAMYLSVELTPLGQPQIGRLFGGKDHTTVGHAKREIPVRMARDDSLAAAVEQIASRILRHG